MSISADYPSPVTVNGFACKNCTDVDYAKKHIDPAHPKDGPFGINAKANRGGVRAASEADRNQAVTFGGQLAGLASEGLLAGQAAPSSFATRLDIRA
jgi:hypothetical protein